MFGFDLELTQSDLESILWWYHKAFKKNGDSIQSDKNTLTKLQAIVIIQQEEKDSELSSGSRRTRL